MADNLTPVLSTQTHVPLPPPPTPTVNPVEADRAEVLNSIADMVSPDGVVDLDAIPSAPEDEGMAFLTAGVLDLSDNEDPFVTTATSIAQDKSLSLQGKFDALRSLQVAEQDGSTPEHKARASMASLEEETAADYISERRARVVGAQIQKANAMQQVLADTTEAVNAPFKKGEWIERGVELIASEISPTGWIKSGHYDPAQFLQELTGIEVGVLDHVLVGDALDEARTAFSQMSPQEQMQRAKQAKSYIMDRAGTFGTDNKWESDRLLGVLAGVIGNVEQYDEAKMFTFFEPIINLSTLGIGGAVVKATKGAIKSSPIKIMAEIAPEASESVVRAAINDVSGTTANKLGATRAELIEDYQLHNTKGDAVIRGPDIRENTVDVQAVTERITALRNQHNVATPEEIAAATEELSGKLDKVDNINFSQSEVYRDEAHNLVTKYRITPDNAPEFASFREAQEFVGKKLEPYQMDGVRVLQYDAEVGEFLPVEKIQDIDEVGAFLVEADYRQTLNTIAKPENVFRRERSTWADGHLDTTVIFNKNVADGITGVEMTTGQVNDILTEVIKPFKSLKRNKQLQVEEVIKEGSDASREFGRAELLTKFNGDESMIKGYNSYRDVYEINHGIRNVQMRDHLQSAGYRQLSYGTDRKSFLKRTTDDVRSAYNPATGKMVDVAEGMEVYKAFSPLKFTDEFGDEAASTYIVADSKLLGPISPQVLPKIPGYIGSHLDAKYILKKSVKGSNGEVVEQVVGFGKHALDLRKEALKLGDSYKVVPSREADTGKYSIQGEAELFADLDMLGHTIARTDLNKINQSYRKHLMKPSLAISKDITTMSRQAGLQEVTKYLVNKWNKTYKDLTPDGQMPWGKFDIPKELVSEELAKAKQAKALHQRIKIMSGMDDETVAGRIKDSMIQAADAWATIAITTEKANPASRVAKVRSQLFATGSKALETASDLDAIAKMKELNFLQFIVFAPARQLVLQAATSTLYTGVEGGTKYAASGEWAKDIAFLVRAKMSPNEGDFDMLASKYAKMSGISVAEAKKTFTDFDNSGLLSSISNHQYMEYASANVVSSKLSFGSVKRASEKGFQIGESANLISAYTIMRNRHVKELGRKVFSEQEARQIAIEAKQLAGNMGNANKAAFQQGLVGVPFQFMSHNVKMLQLMAPPLPGLKNIQMPVISNVERAKIATVYGLLWGTGGYSISGLISDATQQAGIDIDDDVMNVIEEGMMGWFIEASFEGLAGDDANINVSGSFGALAGLGAEFKIGDGNASMPIGSVAEFVHSAMFGPSIPFSRLMGASSRFIEGGLLNPLTNAVNLWDTPAFTKTEKFIAATQNLTTFFPVINEWYQARAAANLGKWVNSKGDPIADASLSEVLAKGILGIEPEAKEAIYAFRTKMEGRPAQGQKPEWGSIKRSGKDTAAFIAATATQLNNGVLTQQEFQDRVQMSMDVAGTTFPDRVEFNVFKQGMKEEMKRITKAQGTTVEELVFRKLAGNKYLQGEMSRDKMFRELKKLPETDHRNMMLEKLPQWFGAGLNTGTSRDVRE